MKFFSPPNQLTFLRILLTPVFLVFLFSQDTEMRQWSLVIFILAAVTDWYDGWIARRWGYVTRWGTFFDPLADKILTSAALIAYVYLGLVEAWMVWIIVIRDIIITLLRSFSEYKGKFVATSYLAKVKTFVQFVVIYYLLILYVANITPLLQENFGELIQALLNYSLVYSMMIIVTILTLWTGISYFIFNWTSIKELYESADKKTQAD
ncbi:MAG: CDP-diacylglycerol--glycerol-3-phosphate 3-phosphatidyltransferase [Bacteroidetes bacterium]|nr:CDP-diacylglycerol--glycerol-3-phosphate 3-phosphatidyltransferase [Bacteroidota bacterium]